MKTSLEIDQEKVKLALKLSGIKTVKELVDKSLDAMISQLKRDDLFSLLGTGFLDSKVKEVKRGRTR